MEAGMNRPRDKISSLGLLKRMEALRRKNGFTYRYHPKGGNPINLGHDKEKAIRRVLDMNHDNSDRGQIAELWRIYQETDAWQELAQSTRDDYLQSSKQLIPVFGEMAPIQVKPSHVSRYLRVERASSPVRANREFALLSNLLTLACDRGDIDVNPCKQVRRNKERPRKSAPSTATLETFLSWAWSQSGQGQVLAAMAEYAGLAGNRGKEFRELRWEEIKGDELQLKRAKQHDGNEVIEIIPMSPPLRDLLNRTRNFAKDAKLGWVFPNADGNCYTAQAFKLGFARLKKAAREAGALENNFTMHDLRSYYVTEFKKKYGTYPEIHADPATTARIYDSRKIVTRKTL
jgi:site-specific recombinase XerD